MIGADVIMDEKNGFMMNVNHQIEIAHKKISEDKHIATACNQGFHAVGFSQVHSFA